jgi:protein TonB
MSFARYISAAVLALGVTLGLILVMHILIQTNIQGPGELVEFRVPDIVMPERELEVEYDTSKPDKPEEAEQPPPDIPKPEFDAPDATNESISVAAPTTEKPTIGGLSTMDEVIVWQFLR